MILLMLLRLAAIQELDKDDERWLERDVRSIITAEESRIFRSLTDDVDRDLFRTIFWARRDPIPATPANEFRLDFERRVALADERFRARVGPGSESEMGRVFLLLGFPASVGMGRSTIALPAGGGIPESLEGSATELTPSGQRDGAGGAVSSPGAGSEQRIQTWVYPPDEAAGFPDGMEVRFRAQPGYGYRLIRSDELDRAFEVRRRALIARPDVGYAIADGRLESPSGDRESLAETILDDLVAGAAPVDDVAFGVSAAFFRSNGDSVYTALLFETQKDVLVFGSVAPRDGRAPLRFEHPEREIPLQLAPGDYDLYLGVLDEETPAYGSRVTSLSVPSFAGSDLKMSSVVLYDRAERAEGPGGVPGRAFQFGSVRLAPKARAAFTTGASLGLFYYVYYPSERAPHLTSRYLFYRDGQERAQTKPKAMLIAEGQALASDEIPLASFEPGQYRVEIRVTDGKTGETLERRVTFRLER